MKMNWICGLILPALLVVSGCTGTYSTIHQNREAYVATRAQAQRILTSAMQKYVPAEHMEQELPESLSSTGIVKQFPFSSTVNALAIPVQGLAKDGKARRGYGFSVIYWGSLPFPGTPARVYNFLKRQAQAEGLEVLTVEKSERHKTKPEINYFHLLKPWSF